MINKIIELTIEECYPKFRAVTALPKNYKKTISANVFKKLKMLPVVGNWTVEKKDVIEYILIDLWRKLGMGIPNNYEDIVQFCYEDVCETADAKAWHSGDVSIAFRRWIESK